MRNTSLIHLDSVVLFNMHVNRTTVANYIKALKCNLNLYNVLKKEKVEADVIKIGLYF